MKVSISNTIINAIINSIGAELIVLNKNDKNYIWTVNEEFWNKTSPVLFPIVGKLKNDFYKINNIQYSLPRHGFARNYNFDIINKTDSSVTFSLCDNKETLAQYPFLFELQICYTLVENKLIISYLVKNNSKQEMPFSLGAHPAFAIDSSLDNYALQFDNDNILTAHELENEQFSGKMKIINLKNKILPLTYSLFEKDALVFKEIKSKYLTIIKNDIPYLKIDFGNFPSLGIWTKKDAPFLCIEPWFGYADDKNSNGNLFDKKGIQILDINSTFSTYFSIEIL
ncbi:MAG: aldose 1-epimerase family protein [Flavobacterium sp.]|uniref:aldose 1-epimerase family protein n=1 Tax=Flavobacterium sp. TaxID=239 RepID=UPI0032665681